VDKRKYGSTPLSHKKAKSELIMPYSLPSKFENHLAILPLKIIFQLISYIGQRRG
jgi:hypothetical protein